MFPANAPLFSEIAGRVSMAESLFSKSIAEISAFYNSVQSSITCIGIFQKVITCIGIFRKVALLEISRNSLSIWASGLYSIGCNAPKNNCLPNFLTEFETFGKVPGKTL